MDKEIRDKLTEALGFKEALEALDRIVEQCTVGGQKAKKPEPEEDPEVREYREHMKYMAEFTHDMYDSFLTTGFDDDQAFELTVEMIKTYNQSLLDNN